ncbi:hypothetical protein SALBM135S_06331 [Streptomyces alboniger]
MTVVERREIALVDLLDRLLAGGVVITGDITLRIADVDLVRIDLNALISSVNENGALAGWTAGRCLRRGWSWSDDGSRDRRPGRNPLPTPWPRD